MSNPIDVKGYRVSLSEKTRDMEIVFFNAKDSAPLARLEFSSTDAYDFAQKILQGYDVLEGINDHG